MGAERGHPAPRGVGDREGLSARFLSRVLLEWGDGEPGGGDGWRRAGCAAGPAAGRRRPGPLREELGRGRQSQPPPPGSGAQCCRAPVTPGAHGRLRSCPHSSASKRGPLIVQLSDRWRSCGGTKLALSFCCQNTSEAAPRGAGCHAQHAPAPGRGSVFAHPSPSPWAGFRRKREKPGPPRSFPPAKRTCW